MGPVGSGGDARHPGESAQQIERLEIGSDVAAIYGAIDEGVDRGSDPRAGGLIDLRWPSNKSVERRRDDLLGGHVVDEEQQPGA